MVNGSSLDMDGTMKFVCENDMTGVLLVANNWTYADYNGNIIPGPKSDKDWLKDVIKDKVVFCGFKTYKTLPKSIIDLPAKWQVGAPTEDCEIHFGGPMSFYTYPPKRLIIHKLSMPIEGVRFNLPCYYSEIAKLKMDEYTKITFQRRW
jgi:hypothetical protein